MEQISTYSKMNAHLLTHTHISRMALYAAFLFIGVLCSVGNAWGTMYFHDEFHNVGSNGNSYTTRTGWTLSNTFAHYNSGIRLGTNGGYATKTAITSIVGTKDLSVTVYAANWNNDGSSLVVTVGTAGNIEGNSSKTFSSVKKSESTGGAVSWDDTYKISFVITGATSSTTITFGTNEGGKRIMLGPVRISDADEDCGIFYESFDRCAKPGGNDGTWSSISGSTSSVSADNSGWSFGSYGYAASSCARFGNSSNKGSAETPTLTYSGTNNLILKFKAGAWNGASEGTTLNLSATNATLEKYSVTLSKGAWTTYAISVTPTKTDFKIKWEAKNASNNRFFLDEICITEDAPSCEDLASINGSVSWTTHNTARVTWSIPTDASSNKKIAGVKLYLYADNAGAKGDAISNTGSTYSSDNTTTYHEFSGLDPETKYWFTIEAFGRTAGGVTYCDAPEGTPVSFTTQPACDDFSFHCGTDGGSDWSVYCFEQVSTTHEWHIENFTIPSTPDLYVGKQNDFKDGSDGYLNSPENAVSNTVAWADAPTKSSSLWQGQIHLVPYNTSSNDLENWGVGLATGATGTVNIYDNSSDKNLFVGFEPDGYGITFGGNSYAFEETATADVWETDVVTLPANLSTTYYIGLETATEGTYVKCAHSETTDQALSTMGHTSKEGGLRKIWCYSTADSWIGSNAKMAIWDGTNEHWGNNTSDTKFMTKVNDNLWYGYVPTNATTLTLARVNPSSDDPNWDWGKSYDITPSDVNNYITITGTWSNNKAEYTLSSFHPSASASGKFRMWDNNSLKNWCTHFVPHYKLTYNANGGSNAPAAAYGNSEITNNVTINNGSGLTPPTGKHFVKWNTANDGSGEDVAAGSYTLTEDLEIFAIYEYTDYTVTVNKSGCASATVDADKTTNVHYGETVTLSADEPAGYAFVNWTTSDGVTFSPNATTKGATFTMLAKNVTVQANYHQIYTITWSVNGSALTGDALDGADVNVEQGSNLSGVPSTAPADNSLNNCANKFMGWSKKSAGSTPNTTSYYDDLFTSASEFVDGGGTITENTTFYAVFAEEVNSGTYSDGTTHQWLGSSGYSDWGGSATYSWLRNNEATIPTHYYTPAYGVKKVVLNVKQSNTTGSNTVAVTIGGTTVGTTQGMGSGTSAFDMTFDHGTGTPLTGEVRIVATNTSANTTGQGTFYLNSITLYEGTPDKEFVNYVTECAANQVRVSYNFNGGYGSACTEGVTTKTASYTVCSTTPTKNFYDFTGWNDGTSTYAAGATGYNLQANTTFTAQWTPTTYNITYELDGGTNSGSNPATYNVTTATITLQNPTKGHDRFDGWYSTYSAGVYSDPVTEIPLGSHGNITLHAKWAERYEIVFDADGTETTIYRADDENLEDAVADQGSKPANPSAPTACSSKVFVGWSESTIDDETNTRPGDLIDATGTVSGDKHYYAVWATSTSGSKTLVMEITRADFDGSYHDGAEQSHTSTAVANDGSGATLSVSWKSVNVGDFSSKIQVKDASGAGFWNTTDLGSISSVSITTGNNITHFENTSVHPTSTSGITKGYFTVTKSEGTGTATKVTVTFTKTVSYYIAYSTSCCVTKVTLSQNSPEHGTIAFGKTSVGTCGDQDVTLTITPAAGYQLHTYEVATGSGKVATKSVSPAISLDNNSSAAQNITLTFADEANGAYDVTASFTKMAPTAWTWTYKSEAIPNPINLYVGQTATLNATYTPSGLLNSEQNYDVTKSANLTQTSKTYASPDIHYTFRADAAMDDGTVTLTNQINTSLTTTVHVHVDPLPRVHFEDLVHGKEFADVVATLSENALNPNKTTKTSVDWTTPNANTCEENHLHLVGWIREDWPALVNYLNGTGDAPTTTAIVGAGNDGSGNAYYFAAGASINVQTFDGVTFYAVWAEIK